MKELEEMGLLSGEAKSKAQDSVQQWVLSVAICPRQDEEDIFMSEKKGFY